MSLGRNLISHNNVDTAGEFESENGESDTEGELSANCYKEARDEPTPGRHQLHT